MQDATPGWWIASLFSGGGRLSVDASSVRTWCKTMSVACGRAAVCQLSNVQASSEVLSGPQRFRGLVAPFAAIVGEDGAHIARDSAGFFETVAADRCVDECAVPHGRSDAMPQPEGACQSSSLIEMCDVQMVVVCI